MKRAAFFRPALAVIAVAAAAGCPNCDPPQAFAIAPEIYLDVCAKPQHIANGVNVGGFQECALDFGTRDISVKVEKNIKVSNPSSVELSIHQIEIVPDNGTFKIDLQPDSIKPGLSGDIIVSVRPLTETALDATLRIHSDANNTSQTDGESIVEVPLHVVGVDNGIPDIEVTPLACDFGRTPVGGVQLCPVQVANHGNRGLVLDSVDFVAADGSVDGSAPLFQVPPESTTETPFAFSGRPPSADEEIPPTNPPEQPVTIQVRFTPDALGNYQGRIRILSNDPDEQSIDVTLSGVAVTPPTCVARVKSINGADVPDGSAPEIQPLDNVIITMEDSDASTPTGTIQTFEWQDPPAERPAGSTMRIANPSAANTGFTFADTVGVDLAGDYKMCGQVFDDLGTGSVNECCVQFSAIPKQHFLVQLSWDTDGGDMDLHVTKASVDNRYCVQDTTANENVTGLAGETECNTDDTGLDCNWTNCKTLVNGGTSPDFDGVTGHTEGDPSLDIDDIDGFGPENINIDVMPGGDYLVGVNDFSSAVDAGCTVRIFIFGQLAGEFFNELASSDWWEVALVHWPADLDAAQPCVEDLTDGDLHDDCG